MGMGFFVINFKKKVAFALGGKGLTDIREDKQEGAEKCRILKVIERILNISSTGEQLSQWITLSTLNNLGRTGVAGIQASEL